VKFVTIRDLRSKTAAIRKDLESENEIVVTANGRPFAVLTRVEPDTVEDEILAIRRARARIAVARVRAKARAAGLDRLTMDDVNALVSDARRERRTAR
jgi:antitoxin (DNA-binding transcriptional repressor) of toxin-antitoxin stability system